MISDLDLQENAGNMATAIFMNVFCVLGVVYFLVWQVCVHQMIFDLRFNYN